MANGVGVNCEGCPAPRPSSLSLRAADLARLALEWTREDGGVDQRQGPRTVPGDKLSEREERELLDVPTAPEYRDLSPRQVIPALAEQGQYIASDARAYRVLRKHGLQKRRENKGPATSRKPAELVAAAPNHVFCWNTTYLKLPTLGTFYYLYLVTDIFRRRIVAARVHEAENDENAAELFLEVQALEGLKRGQVTLHSDNSGPMNDATPEATLERLGILTSFSGPRVRRQPVCGVTLRHDEESRRLPEEAIREHHRRAGVGRCFRALAQRRAPPQWAELGHADGSKHRQEARASSPSRRDLPQGATAPS